MLSVFFRVRGWRMATIALCLLGSSIGAHAGDQIANAPQMPPDDPAQAAPATDRAGGRWIGEYRRIDPPQPLMQRSTQKAGYRPDPRIASMAAQASERLQQRWRQVQFGEVAASDLGEASLRFQHHAGDLQARDAGRSPGDEVAQAMALPKNSVEHTVRMVRQGNLQPVGDFYLYNAAAGRFVLVPASGVITITGTPGDTLSLHLSPPPPLAIRRVALELVAGQTDYTLALADGVATTIDFGPGDGALTQAFWVYFTIDGQANFVHRVASGHDRLEVAFEHDAEVVVRPDISLPYFLDSARQFIGTRRGDVALPMTRGALLRLAMAPSAVATLRRERSNAGFGGVQLAAGGGQVLLPPGEPVRIDLKPEAPWLPITLRGVRFDTDASLDVAFERGVALTLDLRGPDGRPRPMEVAVTGPGEFHAIEQMVQPGHRIAVPTGAPVSVEAKAGDVLARVDGRFAADSTVILQAQPRVQVSGTVRAGPDNAVAPGVRVEAWRNGERVGSDLGDGNGAYRLKLAPGDHELRYFNEGRTAAVVPVATSAVTVAATPAVVDLQLSAAPLGNVQLLLPNAACTAVDAAVVTFEREGLRPAVRRMSRRARLSVAPGDYRVSVEAAGFPSRTIERLAVPASGLASIDLRTKLAGQCRRWTGTLRDAAGAPLPGSFVAVRFGNQELAGWVQAGAAGSFELPLNDGWSAEFQATAAGSSLRQLRPLKRGDVDRSEDVRLLAAPVLAAVQPTEGVAQLLLGDPDDPSRLDIVFIAEAYVGTQETFDDIDGNGAWDGRLFADIDNDGVWDIGEPYALYGDAPAPAASESGTDIRTANEPFDDRNADGYPSIDDPSVFGRNIADFIRELVSLPFWAERQDRINVWALWFDSEQAGMDLIDSQGSPISTRRTAFDGRWLQERSLLAVDYARVEQVVAAYKPDPTLRVVLMNQPVHLGRANSYILYYGGVGAGSPNSTVASHELGHAVGLLADEYEEFRGNYVGMQLRWPNLSKFADPDFGRWTSLVSETPALHEGEAGIGWLDGGGYQYGGLYRPTTQSAMRFNSPLFNAPSRRSLVKESCHRFAACSDGDALQSGMWWNASESGWGLFTFDQGSVLAAAWFTYDDDGEPTWFLLPARPGNDGVYRGEITRFTGTRFDRIDGVAAASASVVGDGALHFDADGTLAFDYRIGAIEQRKSLERFPFPKSLACRASASRDRSQAGNASDLWWTPAQSGWGMFVLQLDHNLYAGWYTYDDDGEPVFMTIAAERGDDGRFVGPIYREHGGTPYAQIDGEIASHGSAPIGTATFRFDDGAHGVFEFTIDGATRRHPIERMQFGSVVSECETASETASD